jgi:kynurenine formamidase
MTAAAATSASNWDRWGPDDQLGTLNLITSAVIRHAATLVRKGRVHSLSLPVGAYQPAADRRVIKIMTETGQNAQTRGKPLWIQDWLSLPLHGSTHWDGLGHIFGGGCVYNGYDAEETVTPAGALRNGIQNTANRIVTRGVLLDVARLRDVDTLSPGTVITPDDLNSSAESQGITFRTGDAIFIRTGWIRTFREEGEEAFLGDQPGIGWDVTQWLHKKQASVVALDNVDAEVRPCEPDAAVRIGFPDFDRPVHYELIRNQGMLIGELFHLDELAEACAKDGVYEFLCVGSPLNIPNATAGPVNPLAIR